MTSEYLLSFVYLDLLVKEHTGQKGPAGRKGIMKMPFCRRSLLFCVPFAFENSSSVRPFLPAGSVYQCRKEKTPRGTLQRGKLRIPMKSFSLIIL
jgi:hypothetical protein